MKPSIKEEFLHFLWQHKLFNKENLISTTGKSLQILESGLLNHDSGPDFFNAKIKIGVQLWAGNVEIHVKSSDWYVHHHELDVAYDSVILHVVWQDDVTVFNPSNQTVITLVLKDYVDQEVLENYRYLFYSPKKFLNCEQDIYQINLFLFQNFKERLYFDRLEKKSEFILNLLQESKMDWEAVLFKMLAKNFGLKVNSESFLQIANAIDFNVFRKTFSSILQLEALLFGLANLLDNTSISTYFLSLKKEYRYLEKKFQLTSISSVTPKFFRLRPNNFPTIRLSQLANLYTKRQNLFSKVMEIDNLKDYYAFFDIAVSPFWQTHYTFDKESKKSFKKLTKSFVDLVLINTIIPLKVVYQKHFGNFDSDAIILLIQEIKAEKNGILNHFSALKIQANNALDSQAILHLYQNYCSQDKCLSCVIGDKILKKTNR